MKIRNIAYNLIFWIAFIYCLWKILFVFAPDFTQIKIIWAGPIAGMAALFFGSLKLHEVMQKEENPEKTKELSKISNTLTKAFLKKEYIGLSIASLVILGLLYKFFGPAISICFVIGVIVNAIAVSAGLIACGKTIAKTANSAEESLRSAFRVTYSGGLVSALYTFGFALLLLPVLYFIYKDHIIIAGFALGACLSAAFLKTGGGILSKAADLSTKIIKKEENTPQENKKLLAYIEGATNITDVAAGKNADLFASYICALIAAIALGSSILNLIGAFLPLTLAAIGIFCSILGSLFARTKEDKNPIIALKIGNVISTALFIIISYYLIEKVFLPGYHGLFYVVLMGILAGCVLCATTQYLTNASFKPVKTIAESCKDKCCATYSTEKIGMVSAFICLTVIAFTSLVSFILIGGMGSYGGGVYGICMAAVGMLTTVIANTVTGSFNSIIRSTDAVDLSQPAKERIEKLFVAGNSANATGKIISIAFGALTSVLLLISFALAVNIPEVDILNPFVSFAIILGAGIPFLLQAILEKSTTCAVKATVNEMKKQTPDYDTCINTATKTAVIGAVIPVIIALVLPVITAFLTAFLFESDLGIQAASGLLLGAVVTSACISAANANSTSALTNANKEFSGSKDTISSSLNIYIMFMAILTLLFAGIFAI